MKTSSTHLASSMAKNGDTAKELQEKFKIIEWYVESFVVQAKFEKARNEELQARYDAHDARMSATMMMNVIDFSKKSQRLRSF